MDHEAFEADVLANANEGTYTEQWTADDSSGQAFTTGETWQGALYGLEENAYGQKAFYRFDTEADQSAWFNGVTEGR